MLLKDTLEVREFGGELDGTRPQVSDGRDMIR
jgi:hypothetical protein